MQQENQDDQAAQINDLRQRINNNLQASRKTKQTEEEADHGHHDECSEQHEIEEPQCQFDPVKYEQFVKNNGYKT